MHVAVCSMTYIPRKAELEIWLDPHKINDFLWLFWLDGSLGLLDLIGLLAVVLSDRLAGWLSGLLA